MPVPTANLFRRNTPRRPTPELTFFVFFGGIYRLVLLPCSFVIIASPSIRGPVRSKVRFSRCKGKITQVYRHPLTGGLKERICFFSTPLLSEK